MYSFDGRVRYSECDEDGRLSLVSMMNYLQDCSTFHSEEIGCGLAKLGEEGLAWILAGWLIEIDELPRYGEKIRTSTWCYELKRLYARRNFTIEDESGRAIVRADSQWFMFDRNAGQVCHVPESQDAYLAGEPRLEMSPMERKLTAEGPAEAATPVPVGRQHLDTNHHVNNAQYVLMAQDALTELGHELDVRRIAVQYRTMAWLGDTIHPEVHACEGGYTVTLTDGADTTYAIVRLQEA